MRLSLLAALTLPVLLAQVPYETITLAGKLPTAEGEPGKEAVLRKLEAISASPDGEIFFSESGPGRIRQLKEDGTLRTIAERPSTFLAAGNGVIYFGATRSLESWRNGVITLLEPASGSTIRPNIVGLTVNYGLAHISDSRTRSVWTSVGPGAFTPSSTQGVVSPGLLRLRDSGLYIVDGGRQVRKSDGTLIAGIDRPGTPMDGALATESPLGFITALAVSPEGEVAMANQTNSELLITRVDQDGVLRVWYDSTRPLAPIHSIRGIEYASNGGLYVLDFVARRILLLHRSGEIEPIAGRVPFAGDGGPAVEALLNSPTSVAVDPRDGSLVFADRNNLRIRRITPDGLMETMAGDGEAAHSGDGGPARQAQLYWPTEVAVDSGGAVYFVEGATRVRRISPDGLIDTVAGGTESETSGDGGPALNARFQGLTAVAVDRAGNIYVCDSRANRVRRSRASDGIVETVAGNGQVGRDVEGVARDLALQPTAIAVDAEGRLIIVLNGGTVARLSGDGQLTAFANPNTNNCFLAGITAVAADKEGVVATDGFKVCRVSPQMENGGLAGPSLNNTRAIVALPSGGFVVADTGNHRIVQVRAAVAP